MRYHYTSLRVFKTADELVKAVVKICYTFPRNQQYIIASQLQRAALSVVLNIVEGNAKRMTSTKEYCRFLKIALGSLYETEYLLTLSKEQNFISEEEFVEVWVLKDHCAAQLWKLISSLEKNS